MARTVAVAGSAPVVAPAAPGTAPVPAGGSITATGPLFRVETASDPLRLRHQPRKDADIDAHLPDGHVVRSVTGSPVNGFIEIETMLGSKLFHGFASAKFLAAISEPDAAAALRAATPPAIATSIPPASLPQAANMITKRTAIAGAHSLNEPDMPGRTAQDPAGLRADLGKIIAYLAPDDIRHKRYQPRDGLTFCNIYMHDYCMLAGVYLPRVWWTQPALLKIAAGQTPTPGLGSTVDEVRANDLFRWLRDFGASFGWRRAASVTELQDHANMGGVSLIVARRKEDGRSGHIVAVVPETAQETAQRDNTGAVTLPLQSQAGSINFSYGRSTPGWWNGDRFAESAFWIHG